MGQALLHEFTDYITKILGCDDAGFADIHATTLNAAISGSICRAGDLLRDDDGIAFLDSRADRLNH